MQKSLDLFKEWKVEIPSQRRALYVHSCKQFNQENVLYMICCWDYIFRPSDEKLQGLVEVFIRNDGPAMINVSYKNRKAAMALVSNPLSVVTTANAKGVTKKLSKSAISRFQKKGGAQFGGAGNYNLMTKAIELTLPECMKQVDDATLGDNRLSLLAQKGAGTTQPTASGRKMVIAMSEYWGAGVVGLQVA